MPIVQVHVGKHELQDALFDRWFNVNIISDVLTRKLGSRKLQLTPFNVQMANQRKYPIGLIHNLKIELGKCTYRIIVTILQMEDLFNELIPCYWEDLC
jgi:hypothetical protein